MNKAVLAILAVWAWYLIWDNLLGGLVMGPVMSQMPGMTESVPKLWEVVGDLFGALVLVLVYEKVKASFKAGVGGGVTYGLYAGILMNFPGWLWLTVYADWPYAATWTMVIVLILIAVVSGALIGLVYGKGGAAQTA